MRIFGSERIASVMNSLGLPDDTPIENGMISKSLETAQKKVEGHNFDIRKHLVEYDDVMNSHREIIYQRRRNVLDNKALKPEILDMIKAEFEAIIHSATDQKTHHLEIKQVAEAVNNVMILPDGWADDLNSRLPEHIVADLMARADELYTDREDNFGAEQVRVMERLVCLKVIDSAWLEHLEAMTNLREGIGLRGYAQRDPLVEYKQEAYHIFQRLIRRIDSEIASTIFKVAIVVEGPAQPISTEITEGAKQASSGGGDSSQSSGSRASRRAQTSTRVRTKTSNNKKKRKKRR